MRRSRQAKRCRADGVPEKEQIAYMVGRSIGRCIHDDAKEEQESRVADELKDKRIIEDKIKKMDNAVIYNLVQLMLSLYEPGEDMLAVCHTRFRSPREALSELR